ncbi:MAG: hypothetical protein WD076_01215 [Parvularculaceae bacterium]
MNKALVLALIAAAGLAAGCAGNAKSKAARLANPAPCPNVTVLTDAARAVEFNGEPTIENVAYTAEILAVELNCRYFADEPIKASLVIDMAFGRGAKGGDKQRSYGYWVAVTRSDLEVIEKAEFIVPVEFDKDHNVRTAKEKIDEIIIPRKDTEISGTNFEVVVGLVLTPQQAIFNRSGKSLKFPEL